VEQLNPTATKYIFQTKNIDSEHIDAHSLLNNVYQNSINLSDVFRLNHYPIQSIEYYEKVKMIRGDVAGAWADNIRDWGYFNSCNEGTTYVDEDLKNMVNSKT
jgi:hypothetical protein